MAATQTKSSRFISGFGAQVLIAMVAGLGLGLLARQLGPAEGQAGYVLAETLRQVGQIDLTTRLLKLGQNVSRESANNRFLVEGSKRDECLTTEQVPEVIGVRLMLGVGGYVSELTTEKIKSSPHGFDLVRAEPTCANDAHT